MRYTKQIKEQAAERIREGKLPLFELAREYGVSTNTLRTWLRESDARARARQSAKRVAATLAQPGGRGAASQRQRLLMHALEQSPATIIVTDAEARIVYANPKFVETTGYAVDEVMGQTPRLLKSGQTAPAEYRALWKTITGGKEWRGTFHNRRKDGTLYWERATISPVLDAEGRIANFMAVKEDITAFMEAEASRRRTAAGFHAVFAALPVAVMLVDSQQRILLANPAAEALLDTSLPPGQALERLPLRWANTEGKPLNMADGGFTSAASEDSALRVGMSQKDGQLRWLRVTTRTLRLPESEERAVLLVIAPAADEA